MRLKQDVSCLHNVFENLFAHDKKQILLLCFGFFFTATAAWAGEPAGFHHYYTGFLGKKLPIQMDIQIKAGKVSGSYYYETIGTPLTLSGKIAEIEELDAKARKTGIFRGAFQTDLKTFEGKWSTADGKKILPFRLTQVATYRSENTQDGDRIRASSTYPHFLSDAPAMKQINKIVNKSMHEQNERFMREGKGEEILHAWDQGLNCSIQYYSEDVISLLTDCHDYAGGAHGNIHYQATNFQIRNAKVVSLKLADLFLRDAPYRDMLSDYVLRDLRKQEASYVVNGDIRQFEERDLHVFSFSPRGLKITFAPYEVAPYAAGSFFVHIPYEALKKVIHPQGPLKRFVTSK